MKTKTILIFALLAFALALQTIPAQAYYSVSGWTPIYAGIDTATGYVTSPRLMRAWALRVDLTNPNVSLYTSHGNGTAPQEVTNQTNPAFLVEHGQKVAVNASYCSVTNPYADVWGLSISNGTVVSPGAYGAPYDCQLRFTAAKVASIIQSQSTPTGIYNAVTGNAYHLVNGMALGANDVADPRTSFGLSADNKYLIMCIVDGRQPGWSDGATVYDMSLWMLDLGAYNAINMDGGGSTIMSRSNDAGGSIVFNRPCYGYPRSNGVHLGVNSVGFTNPPYEFISSAQGWAPGNSASAISWTNCCGWPGVMYFDQIGNDCFVYSPDICYAAPQYPQVLQVSLYPQNGNTASHNMQAFWKTSDSDVWDGSKSSPIVNYTCQNDWTAVNLDMNNSTFWLQYLNKIRLDLDNNNSGTRYIVNHVIVQDQLWYTFDSDTMNWYAGNAVGTPFWWIADGWPGMLVVDQTGFDPFIYSPLIGGPYNYLGGVNDKIHVRLYPTGGVQNHDMQVFWIQQGDQTWDAAKSSSIVYYTGDNQWCDVYIPVGQNSRWGHWGQIQQIRLDFDQASAATRYHIDYIRTEY